MINNEKKDKYLLTKSILFSKIIIGTFYVLYIFVLGTQLYIGKFNL